MPACVPLPCSCLIPRLLISAHLGVLSCTNGVVTAFSQAEDRLEKLKEEAELAKSIAEEEDEF